MVDYLYDCDFKEQEDCSYFYGEKMYDENQLVPITWNNTNLDWYTSRGYEYHGSQTEKFMVKAKDLMDHSSAKIIVTCDYCGKEYKTQYALITNGRKAYPKDSCSKCACKKSKDVSFAKRAQKKFDQVRDVCRIKGYTLLTEQDEYTGVGMDIRYICPYHGEQHGTLDNITHVHGCQKCGNEQRGMSNSLSKEEVINRVNSIGKSILLNPDDYHGISSRLSFRCSCGNEFTTTFINYTKHGIDRCPKCSQKESSGELLIRGYLEANDIPFVQEKRFADCRDNKPLPFDFFLPDRNKAIEFDGKHHYSPIFSEEQHQQTVKHDAIKNEYCKQNGIELLRIPYWKGHDIPEILSQFIQVKDIVSTLCESTGGV